MINFHMMVTVAVFMMALYELIYTLLVLKQKLDPAIRFHMQVHVKYLLVAIPLLLWLEVSLIMVLPEGVLEPVTFLYIWLGGILHHLHGESSAAKKGLKILELRKIKRDVASKSVPGTQKRNKRRYYDRYSI